MSRRALEWQQECLAAGMIEEMISSWDDRGDD
jgi:hypothetical protein